MAENKMEAVAKLFGKRLGERFTINFYGRIYGAAFDKLGLIKLANPRLVRFNAI